MQLLSLPSHHLDCMNSAATFRCSRKVFSLSPHCCRLSTAASNVNSKAFSKTLNLPKTSFLYGPTVKRAKSLYVQGFAKICIGHRSASHPPNHIILIWSHRHIEGVVVNLFCTMVLHMLMAICMLVSGPHFCLSFSHIYRPFHE